MNASNESARQRNSVAVEPGANLERLWTPWRMPYILGGGEAGCIFCDRLAEEDDVASLILYRGDRAFVIMNLFPYNTGHVMIVPNAHVASPEDADERDMAEMAALRAPVLRALRRALSPEGFNLGLNVGAVAGAGVTHHLHEHVVPRWQGDANFMPILAGTMVMPELIPVTYAKLRAELEREMAGVDSVVVVTGDDECSVLLDSGGELPQAIASDDEPLWQAALRTARSRGAIEPQLVGWAGAARAGSGQPALLLRAAFPADEAAVDARRLACIDDVPAASAELIRTALRRLGGAIGPASGSTGG